MLVRRALVTAPLAVAVALTAHLLVFGTDHALGGSVGVPLLFAALSGVAALVAAALCQAMRVGAPRAEVEARLAAGIPGGGTLGAGIVFSLAGFAAFAGGEALEGHAAATPVAILAVGVAAALLGLALRPAVRCVAVGGAALAALISVVPRAHASVAVAVAVDTVLVAASRRVGTRRGRAPPLFV